MAKAKTTQVVNPANGKNGKTYHLMPKGKVTSKLKTGHKAFQKWSNTDLDERIRLLRELGRILHENKEKYARLMTREMGKTLKSAESEVEKCAWNCMYYADHAKRFLQAEFVDTDAAKSYVSIQPLGLILAVMPWNFPFWQVIRFAAPALVAGNTAVLKHASNVPGCALALQDAVRKAGFPRGVFQTLLVDSSMVDDIIARPEVVAVTLTGSGKAGKAVAATAGKHLKKCVLELGGSDPYLILEDADLGLAAEVCAKGRLLNNGQSCIGAKRFIVVGKVYNKFVKLFKEQMASAKMGNPMKEETDLGPLARTDLRKDLHQQVKKSIKKGAKCILGGNIPKGEGAYYPATILTHVKPGMPAYHEELFGPVASVIRARNEADAIRIANDTDFGLGAAVFTKDVMKGERIAREELRAGACFVNAMVKSDPRLPFGGIKDSGYGRELSHYGLKEFVNIKAVYVSAT